MNMESKIGREVSRDFTYEIIERITRFIIHLDEIEKQFYIGSSTSKDKLEFIESYKEVLYKLLNVIVSSYRSVSLTEEDEDLITNHFELAKSCLASVNELHTTKLSLLPRPSEPVELERFKRVIDKQIIQLEKGDNKHEISISINEDIGEGIDLDPLNDFKKDNLNEIIEKYNNTNELKIEKIEYKTDKDAIKHITIPRIDAGNIYRWSSLIHEMAHSLMNNVVFESDDIKNDFLKFIGEDNLVNDFFLEGHENKYGFKPNEKTLINWLTECWCDLFACILIGPSYYFSQYLAFLNEPHNENTKYPPALFRLYLIESIFSSRFSRKLYNDIEENYIGKCENLIAALQDNNNLKIEGNNGLGRISNYFKKYFKKHFFTSGEGIYIDGNEALNKKLIALVKKYVNIDVEVIRQLVGHLDIGLPIPSIRTKDDSGNYREIPTYIQEIFLASWISRCNTLQVEILKSIQDSKIIDIQVIYKNEIEKRILRHDQAILKSIQVSEWFDFFIEEKNRPEKIQVFENKSPIKTKKIKGILVDKDIRKLIFYDELKIIPLMDLNGQIGTTSIDIRLGTGFELFFPDQYGIIDFTKNKEDNKNLSRRVNLDFIEGITIIPGQFLLAHSMEYLKLPDYICGNLEGRSSFARLGIEVHMTAGYIDPGFEGVMTFEIFNAGASTVKLYPGMRIGQIRFERNKIPDMKYGKRHTVKYKGLLEHNVSMQSKDIEVDLISKARIEGKLLNE